MASHSPLGVNEEDRVRSHLLRPVAEHWSVMSFLAAPLTVLLCVRNLHVDDPLANQAIRLVAVAAWTPVTLSGVLLLRPVAVARVCVRETSARFVWLRSWWWLLTNRHSPARLAVGGMLVGMAVGCWLALTAPVGG